MSAEEVPFPPKGNFAPVEKEITGTDLRVEGALPPELSGMYVRQSANPVTGTSGHWFMGEGMVHGVRVENGKALWYKNRYVQTPYLENPEPTRISDQGVIDYKVSKANTSILKHNGQILALEEGSFPYVLTDDLDTVGPTDFDGGLTCAFAAHTKACPVTGELISIGYGQLPPYLTYVRVTPDGKVAQSTEVDIPAPVMMHDMAMSENHVLFLDLPIRFSLEDALEGNMPFAWSDEHDARIGVMPRNGGNGDVKWFSIEPCFMFHTLNAYDEGDSVVLDTCRSTAIWRKAGEMAGDSELSFYRYTCNMKTGAVKEEQLFDRRLEFPRVADERMGQKQRCGFCLDLGDSADMEQPDFRGNLKINFETGETQLHETGPGRNSTEAVFVPAEGADPDSDEGYVMSYVHDENTGKTDFVVLDATDMTKEPIAKVTLPQRVPYGFHGNFIAD
jgi:carotenoid cleavage dioxygenase